MTVFPCAKINLGLNIIERRADGYHNIETVFYPIGLNDVLEVVPSKSGESTLTCYGNFIDCELEKNLVMRACRLMQREFGAPEFDIYLYKHIPDGAGLGGGSADAAFAMVAINEMCGLGVEAERLASLAGTIGADCPFFIYNRPLLATGIGDVFSPVDVDLKGRGLLLVKPAVSVPTKAAYSRVSPHKPQHDLAEVVADDLDTWQGRLVNDFEASVFEQYPELAAIKQNLLATGARYAAMSGSGSSLFGIYNSVEEAEAASCKIDVPQKFVISL